MKVRELIARLSQMPQEATCTVEHWDGMHDEFITCVVGDIICTDDKVVRLNAGDDYFAT